MYGGTKQTDHKEFRRVGGWFRRRKDEWEDYIIIFRRGFDYGWWDFFRTQTVFWDFLDGFLTDYERNENWRGLHVLYSFRNGKMGESFFFGRRGILEWGSEKYTWINAPNHCFLGREYDMEGGGAWISVGGRRRVWRGGVWMVGLAVSVGLEIIGNLIVWDWGTPSLNLKNSLFWSCPGLE